MIKNRDLEFFVFDDFLTKNDVILLKSPVFMLLLTIFSWFCEILKWQKSTSFLCKISFLKTLNHCASSLTASLFTPNCLGDYAAKNIYFHKTLGKQILLLNIITLMSVLNFAIPSLSGSVHVLKFNSNERIATI